MKKKKKVLVLGFILGLFLTIVTIYAAYPRIIAIVTEVIAKHPPGHRTKYKPPLTSHSQAIDLANDFIEGNLGEEFVREHFKVLGVDERPDVPDIWFVIYEFIDDEYKVNLTVAINFGTLPENESRIEKDLSCILYKPQEIKISEQDAEKIAGNAGLSPPYSTVLACDPTSNRIAWRIVKVNAKIGELRGVVIDAESGGILEKWYKGFE